MTRALVMVLAVVALSVFLGYLIGNLGRDKAEWKLHRCEVERDRAAGEAAQYLEFYCEAWPESGLCAGGGQ